MSDSYKNAPDDAAAQISQLREQVQSLMNDRVQPAIAQASDTAKQYASDAREIYDDQAEALSERVREQPVLAVIIAAVTGYVLGRIAR